VTVSDQSDPEKPGTPATGTSPQTPQAAPGLRVDTSELKSSYCNVCNINSTNEEVVLNFGMNDDWDRSRAGEVRLLHRVILSPQAARRVATLLSRVMQDYEARHGAQT
jgi:hypothetical protein